MARDKDRGGEDDSTKETIDRGTMHGEQDALRGLNLTNLVPKTLDAPGLGRLVDGPRNLATEGAPGPEHLVERHLSDSMAHRGLSQLIDCEFGVFDPVGGLVGVHGLDVERPVNLEGDVVQGQGALTRYGHGDLLQGLGVRYAVDERDEKGETGGQGP